MIQPLIQACREAFDSQDYPLVLQLSGLLIQLHPERVEPWSVHAEACIGLGRFEEALEPYGRAVALAPEDAQLRVRFARALAESARHQEALEAYSTAFAQRPDLLSALHGLLSYRRLDPEDPALAVVRAIAAGAPATPGSQAFACFLLGRILAIAGRDDKAFAEYARGNGLVHAAFAGGGRLRGPEEFQRWWAPRARAGSGGLPCAESQRREAACPALLVTGLPRAGKSLVEHLLCSHPALAAGQELGGLHEAVEPCTGEPHERIAALRAMAEGTPASRYASALDALKRPETRWLIDTAPPNLWDLGYLAALHPEVPVILCRRDPLDLGAALFCKRFSSGHAYSYEQEALGRMLALAEQAIALWAQRLPNPIQLVDYEQLVSDPLGTRRRLLSGLGLDPGADPELGSEVNREGEGTTPSPGLHASHSPEGYGAIVSDLVGFGQRFARQLAPMLESYARQRELLQREG